MPNEKIQEPGSDEIKEQKSFNEKPVPDSDIKNQNEFSEAHQKAHEGDNTLSSPTLATPTAEQIEADRKMRPPTKFKPLEIFEKTNTGVENTLATSKRKDSSEAQTQEKNKPEAKWDSSENSQLSEEEKLEKMSRSEAELRTIAENRPELEPTVALDQYRRTLPDGPEKEKLKQLVDEEKGRAKQKDEPIDDRPIREFQPEKLDKKTYSLGLAYENGSPEDIVEKEVSNQQSNGMVTERKDQGTKLDTNFQTSDTASIETEFQKQQDTSEGRTPEKELPKREILAELSALPLDKQIEVVGNGILAFQKELNRQQIEITKATIEGIGEGAGEVVDDVVNLAKGLGAVWQFGQDVMTNNPRAIETSAKAGDAIGKTLVGGIKIFEMSHDYLYNIGYTGDYSKPFQDISNLANELDRRWNEMTPAEQARITSKLSTKFLADTLTPLAANKVAKSGKLTEALEKAAEKAKKIGGKTADKVVDDIASVVDDLADYVSPTEELATIDGPSIKRRRLSEFIEEQRQKKEENKYLMAMSDDSKHRHSKHSDSKGSPPEQPGDQVDEIKEKPSFLKRMAEVLLNKEPSPETRLKKWQKEEIERLKELADPLDPKLSKREAADLAIEHMVKPLGIDDPLVKSHYEKCKRVLKESIPEEDIMALYGKGGEEAYKIHFPDKFEDVSKRLAKMDTGLMEGERGEHLLGATISDEKISCVPRLIRIKGSDEWVEPINFMKEHGVEFVPEGVVRHEIGMCLIDIYGWKNNKSRFIHNSARMKIIDRIEALETIKNNLVQNEKLKREISELSERYKALNCHTATNEIGLEQTLADLYAVKIGGSAMGNDFDRLLIDSFSDLNGRLER